MERPKSTKRIPIASALMLSMYSLACVSDLSPPPLVLQSGPKAEVTVDGLHRASGSQYRKVWVRPDAMIGDYDAFILEPVSISYKRDPRGRTRCMTGGLASHHNVSYCADNYALTSSQTESFKSEMWSVFSRELARAEHLREVTEPGPGILSISAVVTDLVVEVPTEPLPGRDRILASSFGRMTLLLELRDSESGEILARAEDRREARLHDSHGTRLYDSNPVSNASAARRVFSRWATILRRRLEALQALPVDELSVETALGENSMQGFSTARPESELEFADI